MEGGEHPDLPDGRGIPEDDAVPGPDHKKVRTETEHRTQQRHGAPVLLHLLQKAPVAKVEHRHRQPRVDEPHRQAEGGAPGVLHQAGDGKKGVEKQEQPEEDPNPYGDPADHYRKPSGPFPCLMASLALWRMAWRVVLISLRARATVSSVERSIPSEKS